MEVFVNTVEVKFIIEQNTKAQRASRCAILMGMDGVFNSYFVYITLGMDGKCKMGSHYRN